MALSITAYVSGVDCVRCLGRDLGAETTTEDDNGVIRGAIGSEVTVSFRKYDKPPAGERQHYIVDSYGVDFDWFVTFVPDKSNAAATTEVMALLPTLYAATTGDGFVAHLDTPVTQWRRENIVINAAHSRHAALAEAFAESDLAAFVTLGEIPQK